MNKLSRENQRVRITKQMIQRALINLLSGKSIHKISVREICEAADINRTTFYKYYGSQYDLLADMEKEILEQVEYELLHTAGIGDQLSMMNKLLEFFAENAAVCKILLNNNVDPDFPEKLFSMPLIRQVFEANMESGYNRTNLDYLFLLITSGCFAVVKSWINKENRESAAEISELLNGTIMRIRGF